MKILGASQPCQLNVNCHDNNHAGSWGNVKKGVSLINMIDSTTLFDYTGTGFLLNNTSNDGSPLYLTAFHNADENQNCLIDSTEISAIKNEWEFVFNFEIIYSINCSI